MSLLTQDPDYRGFSGTLKTDMRIGVGALVEVAAVIDNDELSDLVVMYRGVEIADALNDAAKDEIERHLAKNWTALVHDARRDAALALAEAMA